MYNMNDSVVQEVHYGAKSQNTQDPPNFTEEEFSALVNPNILQDAPLVLLYFPF